MADKLNISDKLGILAFLGVPLAMLALIALDERSPDKIKAAAVTEAPAPQLDAPPPLWDHLTRRADDGALGSGAYPTLPGYDPAFLFVWQPGDDGVSRSIENLTVIRYPSTSACEMERPYVEAGVAAISGAAQPREYQDEDVAGAEWMPDPDAKGAASDDDPLNGVDPSMGLPDLNQMEHKASEPPSALAPDAAAFDVVSRCVGLDELKTVRGLLQNRVHYFGPNDGPDDKFQ